MTVTIPWRTPILRLLLMFPAVAAWAWLLHIPPLDYTAWISAIAAMEFGGRPSKARQWTAHVVGWALAVLLPTLAEHAVLATVGHRWYALWPAEFLGAAAAVYGCVALTRIPGFEPPVPAPKPPVPETAPPLWTPAERASSFDGLGRVVFRRSYPIIVNSIFFGFLTVLSLGAVIATLTDDEWRGAAVAVLACVFLGGTTVRSFRLVVIADADGILVRNLLSSRRIAWAEVCRIVPPSVDEYGYVRIDRLGGDPIRSTALAKGVFQRRFAPDQAAGQLAALVGPAPIPAEAVV